MINLSNTTFDYISSESGSTQADSRDGKVPGPNEGWRGAYGLSMPPEALGDMGSRVEQNVECFGITAKSRDEQSHCVIFLVLLGDDGFSSSNARTFIQNGFRILGGRLRVCFRVELGYGRHPEDMAFHHGQALVDRGNVFPKRLNLFLEPVALPLNLAVQPSCLAEYGQEHCNAKRGNRDQLGARFPGRGCGFYSHRQIILSSPAGRY